MPRTRFFLISLITVILSLGASDICFGQYRLIGKVVDAEGGFPLSAASIQIGGSNQGTISNADGVFSLWADSYPISLNIRHIGYTTRTVRIAQHKSGTHIFRLNSETIQLEEVEISDEDPALSIMRKVLTRKREMRSLQSSFEADSFTRFLLYRRKYREDVLIQLKEQIGKSFWRPEGGGRQYVHAEITHPEESGAFKFADIRAVPNLYDDFVEIFGTRYIAPTHPDALKHYTFRFGDKKSVDGDTVYEIYLTPKSASRSALVGRIRVLDGEYVLLDASLKPNRFAVPTQPVTEFDITYEQQFAEFEKGIWLPIDFAVAGWLEFGRSGTRYPRATFRQATRLTRHLLNGATPDSIFAKRDLISYDPIYKFRDFLFNEITDFIQLTEIEAKAIQQIRPEGKLSDEFVPSGLLAGYIAVPFIEKNSDGQRRPWFARPSLWFNRVDGFRLGLSENTLAYSKATLYFKGGIGFSRLQPDFEIGLRSSLLKRDLLQVTGDLSIRDELTTNLPFSSWSRLDNSIPAYLGSPDFFDYHRRQGVETGIKISAANINLDLGLSWDKLSSVRREASETPWLFDRLRRDNPSINERTMLSPQLALNMRLPESLPRGIEGDITAHLQQNFDSRGDETDARFRSASVRATIKIPTFSYRRSTPSSIVLSGGFDKLSGSVPDFVRVGLDTSLLHYGRVGVFSTKNEQFFRGNQVGFFSWEKRFETLPFEWLRLYPLSDRGMSLSAFGNHGWLKSGSADTSLHEWGIRLHRILGYPLQIHAARAFRDGHWVFGFGWRP